MEFEKLLGPNDPPTMQYSRQLAENLCRLGETHECEKLCRANVQASELAYGRDNHNTLECMQTLADAPVKQFRIDEAEPLMADTWLA